MTTDDRTVFFMAKCALLPRNGGIGSTNENWVCVGPFGNSGMNLWIVAPPGLSGGAGGAAGAPGRGGDR